MKIVFDLDAVIRNPYSGFYTFGKGLLQGINELPAPPEMVLLYQHRYRQRAKEIAASLGSWVNTCEVRFKFRWLQNIWNYIPYPDITHFTGDYHIFHSFHHFMPPSCLRPTILTVHDLRRYVMPELYPLSNVRRFEAAVAKATHFVAVSESTKHDMMKFFNIPAEKIDVVHLACDLPVEKSTEFDRDSVRKSLLQQIGARYKRYFVALSSKDYRKNIARISNAFMAATGDSMLNDTALIILGRLPEGFTLPDSENIFNIGEVDDIIPWLACSSGLIFASLYEGFGLPILEGFAAGVPVITSSVSSMPEVAGNAAAIVNPEDEKEIAAAIRSILTDPIYVEGKKQLGKQRLQEFSWEKAAEKTVNIYRKVYSGMHHKHNHS